MTIVTKRLIKRILEKININTHKLTYITKHFNLKNYRFEPCESTFGVYSPKTSKKIIVEKALCFSPSFCFKYMSYNPEEN